GRPYPYEKLDLIAAPEFLYGAMENAGAVIFADRALLIDPRSVSPDQRRRVTGTVAHELAHMWFGDLVTMKWWDDLWLNESFATFMDFKSTDRAYPEWKVWQDFVRTSTSGAMGRDALTKTHPIMAKVHDPEEIEELFDEISYGKGAARACLEERALSARPLGIDQRRQSISPVGTDLFQRIHLTSREISERGGVSSRGRSLRPALIPIPDRTLRTSRDFPQIP